MNKYRIEIKRKEDEIHILIYEENNLIEVYKEEVNKKRLEGNIYIGIVKDVIKGMQSAFIDRGEEKNALIHIKDIMPKESNITGNVNLDLEKYDIQKILRQGDKILVQIKRDCDNQKGSRVTKDIKLTGRYTVLMPYSKFITVSSKISHTEEKNRLTQIAKKYVEDEYGIIIRTSAEEKDESIIKQDIEELKSEWKEIINKVEKIQKEFISTYEKEEKLDSKSESKLDSKLESTSVAKQIIPVKVYNNNGIIGKLITDFEPLGLDVFVDCEETKRYVIESTKQKIDIKIKEIQDIPEMPRKIWLKCGGFITIDKCEALTAIDVNSGKFTGNSGLEDTVLKVNLDATSEIAKQIRLRDIGGIIIVDYIDMQKEEDRHRVREAMEEAVKMDRSKVQVLEFTKLGLLEITRKYILGR